MKIFGIPSEWKNLIDNLVPEILDLVISTWDAMPKYKSDVHENIITKELCLRMRLHKNSVGLPFQIHFKSVEIEPEQGEKDGEMDIGFYPIESSSEDIYFCLECKRLNVISGGRFRTLSTEYVSEGMLRFIKGQYSSKVHHGGMLAYVMDGKVKRAISNVKQAIQNKHVELRMQSPGQIKKSSILPKESKIKETHHTRSHDSAIFRIHHIFVNNN